MNRKIRTILISLVCILILGIAGCGKSGAQAAGGAAAPVQQHVLTMQTIHGTNTVEFKMQQEMAAEILAASGGRLKVEPNPLGTFASSMESFQACINGVFDICINYGTWLRSVDYALHVVTTGNMAMDPIAKRIWLHEFGGFKIVEKLYDKAGLVFLTMHTDGTEIMMAREPYTSPFAMKNKIFRTSDTRLMRHPEVGIAGITMPLEEIFTAFQTGAIDVIEYSHLAFNQQLGLTDVAKFGVYPDFWNVNNSLSVAMNKAAYQKLPADLQALLKMGFRAYEFKHFTATQFASAEMMKQLESAGKMKFSRMQNIKEFARMRKLMIDIEAADIKQYGESTKEVFDSFYAFYKVWYPYKSLSRWWGEDLTPEEMAGFPIK